MARLIRDGTTEPVSRDQILRPERGQGKIQFPCCSADHEQDWQPYSVDPYLLLYVMTIHTYIHKSHLHAISTFQYTRYIITRSYRFSLRYLRYEIAKWVCIHYAIVLVKSPSPREVWV